MDKRLFRETCRFYSDSLHVGRRNPTIIYGDYDTGGLTISFSGYDGDVIVSFVNATTGDISMSEEVIIESPDMMTIDLSTLSHSTYYVLIELDNGDCYYATIRI